MKLCLSPPQDKIGMVQFSVKSSVLVAGNSNLIKIRPCSGFGWIPSRNAVWLSARSDGITLPCPPCRLEVAVPK